MLQNVNNKYIHIEILLLLLSLLSTMMMYLDVASPKLVVHLHFYIYVIMIAEDFIHHKRFRLFQIWILGFVFMLLSEMILIVENSNVDESYISAFSYLFSANAILLVSYILYKPKYNTDLHIRYVVKSNYYGILIITFVITYLLMNYAFILNAFENGARVGSGDGTSLGTGTLSGALMGGLSLLLPALIAHYSKLNNLKYSYAFILATPILIFQMLGGTRFRLLFATLPFLIILDLVSVRKTTLRNHFTALLFLLGLVFAASFVKEIRNTGINDYFNIQQYANRGTSNTSFLANLAGEMSPEGCVKMTIMANDYFSKHELHYGRESGFIFIFWIPRSVWKDKPTQLDHWLIRQYEQISSNYSSASAFTGEIRADFGFLSYLILILWGFLLKYAEIYVHRILSIDKPIFNKIFAATLFPYVFFFVRSPLTASFSLIGECIIYFILCKVLTKRKLYSTKGLVLSN